MESSLGSSPNTLHKKLAKHGGIKHCKRCITARHHHKQDKINNKNKIHTWKNQQGRTTMARKTR
jgi:hypothetical protein